MTSGLSTAISTAIRLSPDHQNHYSAMRARLYTKFDIETNEAGEPIDEFGTPIVSGYSRPTVPDIHDMDEVAEELPPGMTIVPEISAHYDVPRDTVSDYLRRWRMRFNRDLIVGYCRHEAPREDGLLNVRAIAYYDKAEVHAYLLEICDKDTGAKRMLANVGIGTYSSRRGGTRR